MTLGCRWQEKSFNVAVKETFPSTVCDICGSRLSNVQYIYNGNRLCQCCFSAQSSLKKRLGIADLGFNTHKDKAYYFVTDLGGKKVEINSKKQFKALLKKHNLADASIKETRQEARFRRRVNEESDNYKRRKLAVDIFNKNRELLRFRKPK